jgi:DNA-binding response OmpR family regulator
VSIALNAAGYDVHLSSSGKAGVADAQRVRPSLILLDFRLPDLRAEQVCESLAAHPATAKVPIILMSARDDDVRGEINSRANTVDFISKPFTGPALLDRIHRVLTDDRKPSVPAEPVYVGKKAQDKPRPHSWSFAEKEQAAKALVAKLRTKLALVPEWMKFFAEGSAAQTLPPQEPPAIFLAKRVLTPEVVEDILSALAPIIGSRAQLSDVQLLSGSTTVVPLFELLRVLAQQECSGELVVRHGSTSTILFLRRGAVLHVTTPNVQRYLQTLTLDTKAVPTDVLERANDEQQRTGKPLPVTLDELGFAVVQELPELLQRRGMSLLLEAAAAEGSFRLSDLPLPAYAERLGRPISRTQAELQRLRADHVALGPERSAGLAQTVFRRAPGFSRSVRQLQLDAVERLALTLIDGRVPLRQVAARSGRPEGELLAVAHRLAELKLISAVSAGPERPGSVQIAALSTEIEDVLSALEEIWLCAGRSLKISRARTAAELVEAVGGGEQVLAFASGDGPVAELAAMLTQLRAIKHGDVPVVAVVDCFQQAHANALMQAGADAVLARPIHMHDLDELLG